MKYTQKAFTLVELVVVTTIIAILAATWFIAYTWYIDSSRDTNRQVQLSDIRDGMELYSVTSRLPLPEWSVDISMSGDTFAYQWNLSEAIMSTIGYQWWEDPENATYPVYMLAENKKDFQIMTFLLDTSSQVPIQFDTTVVSAQEYDISSWTLDLTAYLSDDSIINSSQQDLSAMIPNQSCKRILEMWKSSWSDIYTINPTGAQNIRVYCDMETDGGGWTLVWRSVEWWSWNFWWLVTNWSPNNDSVPYSMWPWVKDIEFSEILVSRYSVWKNIELATRLTVDNSVLKNDSTGAFLTQEKKIVYDEGILDSEKLWDHTSMFTYWWNIQSLDSFWFRRTDWIPSPFGLKSSHIDTFQYNETYWAFDNKQWMVFIR